MSFDFDVIIIGGGLTGQSAALACANIGLLVAIIDGRDMAVAPVDGRASALAASSMRMMTRLGVDIVADVQPFNDVLVTEGGPDSPWRLHFDSEDHGEPTAFTVENSVLYAALYAQIKTHSEITVLSNSRVQDWAFETRQASITLDGGETLSAPLIIAADGRNSATRRAAGISVRSKKYDQSALVTTIAHSQPHDGLALQRFYTGGPLAVLPLTGNRCQIVWSDKTAAIDAAMTLDEAVFTDLLVERIGDYLGQVSLEAPRQSYPLGLQMSETQTGPRLALVGDAAHVIHPLAGQGLNLGLKDVAVLADSLRGAYGCGQDLGVAGVESFAREIGSESRQMGMMTDGLSGLFSSRNPALGHLRRAGLSAVDRAQAAKSFFMTEAAGGGGTLPTLMHNLSY